MSQNMSTGPFQVSDSRNGKYKFKDPTRKYGAWGTRKKNKNENKTENKTENKRKTETKNRERSLTLKGGFGMTSKGKSNGKSNGKN
jgi:hypothetical protein